MAEPKPSTSEYTWRYRETTDEEWLVRISDVVEKVWKVYSVHRALGIITGFAAMKKAAEGIADDIKAIAPTAPAFIERLREIAAEFGQMRDVIGH
jgi:hypothetical protein